MNKTLKTAFIALVTLAAACTVQPERASAPRTAAPVAGQSMDPGSAPAPAPAPSTVRPQPGSRTDNLADVFLETEALAGRTVAGIESGSKRQKAEASVHHAATVRPPAPGRAGAAVDRENYLAMDENGIHLASERPLSTFSVDVDTASYSNIRRMLVREGRLPPTDAVRLEEMVNYFRYDYPVPEDVSLPFSIATEVAPAPWNPDRLLLQVGIRGYEPPATERPAANLVFLVDVSGSMRSEDKLGLVKRSLGMLVNQMRADDRIALVVYAGAAGLVLDSTPARQRGRIRAAIDALQAGGSTNGGAGIELAYRIAGDHRIPGGINRVIIASDGDMNVGMVNPQALKDLVARNRESGIALTTLGFGSGNYNDGLMEQLADVGDGNAAYIDSILEARKVLVSEMQSTLLTIARDVKIQVEFNPAQVREYRLLGYGNRLLKREDFRNDRVDAGDIGAGHTVTALYEIQLADGSPGMIPALRYGDPTPTQSADPLDNELAYVRLRYKQPGADRSGETGQPVSLSSVGNALAQASDNLRFAAAVAGFGQILSRSRFTAGWNYRGIRELAQSARGSDPAGHRAEFIRLVDMAEVLDQGISGLVTRE